MVYERKDRPIGVALIGSGRMGSFHGQTLAQRLQGVRLVAVADPAPGAAAALAADTWVRRRLMTIRGTRSPIRRSTRW